LLGKVRIWAKVSKMQQILLIKWSSGQYVTQVAQLSQKDRAAGWVIYSQKWKTVIERQYFTDIIGLSSTTMT